MRARGYSEEHIEAVLDRPAETFVGVSITGAWVYHRRVRHKNTYVLVEPHSDPMVIISVRLWRPVMRQL